MALAKKTCKQIYFERWETPYKNWEGWKVCHWNQEQIVKFLRDHGIDPVHAKPDTLNTEKQHAVDWYYFKDGFRIKATPTHFAAFTCDHPVEIKSDEFNVPSDTPFVTNLDEPELVSSCSKEN